MSQQSCTLHALAVLKTSRETSLRENPNPGGRFETPAALADESAARVGTTWDDLTGRLASLQGLYASACCSMVVGVASSNASATSRASSAPTRTGGRRDRQNVNRVVQRSLRRANELRAHRGEPAILAHVTPHTLRRSCISFMLAAGYDLPYVQAQVGHEDPTTTLGIYARVIRQPNRDRLRRQMLALLDSDAPVEARLDRGQERLF